MIESSPPEDVSEPSQGGESALTRLRVVIADEYVSKLPAVMTIGEFARFVGMTIRQVRHATSTGDLVVSIRDGMRGIAPADNVAFLLRERLLVLRAPGPTSGRRDTRSLAVSEAAYERVWDEAVRAATTPTAALDRLILAATATRSALGDR